MPTELPYAADAEVSLQYDELEVCRGSATINLAPLCNICSNPCWLTFLIGSSSPVFEGAWTVARYHSNEIQLCLGPCKKSCEGSSSRRGTIIARCVWVNA